METLLSRNLGMRDICETLLEEDNVYVKYNTLKRKRRLMLERAAIGILAHWGSIPRPTPLLEVLPIPRRRSTRLSYRGPSPHRPNSIFNL